MPVRIKVTVDRDNQRRALRELVQWAQLEALRMGEVFGVVDVEETLDRLRGEQRDG